ncbi:MAG: sarcosine oxidase subunit alpha family protein [Pseudomonadota bacterium]
MTQPFRLTDRGLVNRNRPVQFTFAGKAYEGFKGDTLASALLANGVHMVGRSFKYHRPRGIVGAGSDDPAGIVQIGLDSRRTDPNTRVTEQEVYHGLDALPQNCWPSLDFDVGALNDVFSRFIPAGFYYKTFMGPPLNWMFFEKYIRAAAGLGVAPRGRDPDRYEAVNRHCDVLVAGGGIAGIAAALNAARAGARVILAEETAAFGGHLLSMAREDALIDGKPARSWAFEALEELENNPDVIVLKRTTVFGYYGHNFLGLWERAADHLSPTERTPETIRQRVWRVRAKRVVLATGALERPLVFNENDRPGIMLAGAVRTFLHRYGVLAGRRAGVFTNNDTAWQTAFDLVDAGAAATMIVDTRRTVDDALLAKADALGIPVRLGSAVVATDGRKHVRTVDVMDLSDDGKSVTGAPDEISLDLLATSGGWSPNVALFSQSRGKLSYDDALGGFRPGVSFQAEQSAGGANGTTDFAAAVTEGAAAGLAAAETAGFTGGDLIAPAVSVVIPETVNGETIWQVPVLGDPARSKAFVDLQDDVTTKDLKLAYREGYRSVEHVKRYTTTGMGTDQGKIANLNAFGILSGEMGKSIPQVGVTTFRQPYKPVTFGALAGQHVDDHFLPRRTTPMHAWHREAGAIFEPVGDWIRARAYPHDGESFDDAVQRESKAARTSIGALDASTLGKIDIRGKDAREFLNRVYTNAWSKLQPGRCRYGFMLGEDGMVLDDGVTACLADDHFHMTTTTGGAARVLGILEDYLQTEWPDLDVYLTTVTEQWAVAALCGPKSPDLVKRLCAGLPDDPAEMPFMSFMDATIDGVPVRVFRISFTGEMSFEINIQATYGHWLWEKVLTEGAAFDITPYGTEAMHLLRAEKGFVIVGQETDGTVTPLDMRMDWIVNMKKGDFIGKRSLLREDTARTDRKQLVGLLTEDPKKVLVEGAHVIDTPSEPAPPVPMLGWVTSSYFSPNLERSIAMALVERGGARMGETVYVTYGGAKPAPARIVETDFLANREDAA